MAREWNVDQMTQSQRRAVQRAARKHYARNDFLGFAQWIRPGLRVNKHHEILADYIQRWVRGDINRLMVFAPPRHGKSEFISRIAPAYIFGVRPESAIIACSYAARLAQKMNTDVQRFLDSPQWKGLYPSHGLGESNVRSGSLKAKRNADEFEIQLNQPMGEHHAGAVVGSYSCAGAGGPVTGFGADFGIIDDPIKDSKQASSPVQREALLNWYQSTFYTRLQKPGAVLLMHTRWDEEDLAGQLLATAAKNPDADQWTVVNLPAIYDPTLPGLVPEDTREPGQALWPARFDEKRLAQIKNAVGLRWWNALYQGTPVAAEGTIFKRDSFEFYESFDDFGGLGALREIVFSADLAFDGDPDSDYVVFQVWGRTHNDHYFLLDQLRGQWDLTASLLQFEVLRQRWPTVRRMFLEKKANGSAFYSSIKQQIADGFNVVLVSPQTSKILRCYAVEPLFQGGVVHFPLNAPFTPGLIKEFTGARPGTGGDIGGVKHDDQIDTTTQVLIQWALNGSTDPRDRLRKLQLLSGKR